MNPGHHPEEETNAERQARLASERTMLAWWRTGLAAFAVGLATGRFLPDLNPGHTRWPYVVVGLFCGIYGMLLFGWGQRRMGPKSGNVPRETLLLAWGGLLLGLLVCGLILID